MLSTNAKVLRIIDQPAKNDNSPFSIYHLEMEFGPGCSGEVHFRRDEYEAFLLERQMLDIGVHGKALQEYRDKIREITSFDESINNDDV